MADIKIIGAGLSGLIAGALLALRHKVTVIEKQEELPDNHHGVLRFRSPKLGEALGIPFAETTCIIDRTKTVPDNALRASLCYSKAVTGTFSCDRSIARLANGPIVEKRWLAPPDFRDQLLRFPIEFGVDGLSSYAGEGFQDGDGHVISTVPMPVTVSRFLSDISPTVFHSADVVNIVGEVVEPSTACGTVYNSSPSDKRPWSRISISGREVRMEIPPQLDTKHYAATFRHVADQQLGAWRVEPIERKAQLGARIMPISEGLRRRTLMRLTDECGIYSLGRHATWRPGLLLEDLISDVRVIEGMIARGVAPYQYEVRK